MSIVIRTFLADAKLKGKQDGWAGKPLSSCPYTNAAQQKAYEIGWNKAAKLRREEDERLISV